MEKLRILVNEIAYTPLHSTSRLSPLHLSLVPFLSLSSSLYKFILSLRHRLYHLRLFRQHRLPVPVISVGNLTWGGNGKTPMVEFIATWLANSGISTLILTRGYGGGDEAKMLERHLGGTCAKIGVGANRAATAISFLQIHGSIHPHDIAGFKKLCSFCMAGNRVSDKIGVVLLDDGMQHLRLWRDLEIVMINGLMPWGNHQLIPFGPLREPLTALRRADAVVIHHADLVSEENRRIIKSTIREVSGTVAIHLSGMIPSHFFEMRPLYVDRLDYSDHHQFQIEDVDVIITRLLILQSQFASKPIVVVTEKDYDRDPEMLKHFDPFRVLVLCSKLEIIPFNGCSEENFKKLLMQPWSEF